MWTFGYMRLEANYCGRGLMRCGGSTTFFSVTTHDDVIKWKHFPRYWTFVRGIHRWPVNSPNKGQWRRALIFSLICAWMNGWVNNREAGDLRRHLTHYDVIVMWDMPIFGALCSLAVWFRLTKPICAWIFHWKLKNKRLFSWQYQYMDFEMVGLNNLQGYATNFDQTPMTSRTPSMCSKWLNTI